jgi:hypothetical protein
MTSHKVCSRCGTEKLATYEFFDRRPANKDGLSGVCIECRKKRRRENYLRDKERENASSRSWYHNNKDKAKEYGKEYQQTERAKHSAYVRYMKRTYGLTEVEFQSMMDKQMGSCAICSTSLYDVERDRRPSVDHCHETGTVRGLLCGNCNMGIGQFQDDPELVLSAYNYLKEN